MQIIQKQSEQIQDQSKPKEEAAKKKRKWKCVSEKYNAYII